MTRNLYAVTGAVFFVIINFVLQEARAAIGVGDPFPVFTKPNTLTPEECFQLKIKPDGDFSLNDIQHEVTILEFLNVYCHTCRQQVKIFNEIFKALQEEPELKGKACILGIAVGNTEDEIREFKKNFGANYPILPDTKKEVFRLVGNLQGTPHTYILRKEDQRFVIDYHAGGVDVPDRYIETIRFALRGTFTGTALGNKVSAFSFKAGGRIVDFSTYLGKPVVLYFPVQKTYPLTNDTRNRGNQIKILHDIRQKFSEVTVIAFQGKGIRLPRAIAEPSFIIADEAIPGAMDEFRSSDAPAVYFINRYGRISFKGEAITLYNAETILAGKEYRPELKYSEQELIGIIEKRIKAGGKEIESIEKEVLESGKAVFIISLKPRREGIYLFSVVESRPSLCDICHDSHFVYVVDQDGIFRDFFALRLTKLGNIPWTEEDMEKIKKQILGKTIFTDFSFDPRVDAVSTATMSSSLVYEAFNDAKKVFANYKGYKFRYEHWKAICFSHICKIKSIAATRPEDSGELSDEILQKILTEHQELACPHDGSYVVLDNSILCTIHGLHTKPCNQ